MRIVWSTVVDAVRRSVSLRRAESRSAACGSADSRSADSRSADSRSADSRSADSRSADSRGAVSGSAEAGSARGLRAACALAIGVVCAAGAACAPAAAPAIAAHALTFPLSGPCPADDTAAAGEFAAELTEFAATVTAPDLAEPVVARGAAPLVVAGVPAGADRVIALFGLSNTTPTWRGVSAPVDVADGEDTPVDVLLARIADLSCARTTMQSARVFHTATLLDDGSVLVVGGADAGGAGSDESGLADASATCGTGCLRATATTSAALYNPRTGRFTPTGALNTARMFHTAAKLADGRVVIAGGTREALLRPIDAGRFPFPIDPTGPLATIEVYDPATSSFRAVGSDPGGARVFAAATTLPDGEVIITGGIPETTTSRHDLGNALNTSTVCGGSAVACREGPALARRRAGHAAFVVGDRVYLWGGSVELDPATSGGIEGFHMEMTDDVEQPFVLTLVAAMQETRNVFFAGTSRYFDSRVISVGGLVRNAQSGAFNFALADTTDGALPGGAVYVFDRRSGENGGLATGKDVNAGTPAMRIRPARFLPAVDGLPGGRTAMIAGGFTALDFTPSNAVERYDETKLVVTTLPVGGADRVLREPRGGVTATSLGDGTVLFAGGLTTGALVRQTAEVYADISTPPQAAPLE